MHEDVTGQAIALLGVDKDNSGSPEVELRACAMLQVALTVLDRCHGRERAVGMVSEALDVISTPDRERTFLALATTPAEQLADVLLAFLRQRDPARGGDADQDAGAMILAGLAFLLERHGADHMAARTADLVGVVREAGAAGEHPISAPPSAAPAPTAAPAPVAAVVAPPYRAGLTLGQRIDAMAGFLRASVPAEGQADALAAFMASGMYLRERHGEAYAVAAIREAEAAVSQQAWLDRLRPAPGALLN